jgi:uncharacterized protein
MWSAGLPGVGSRHIRSRHPILSVAALPRTRQPRAVRTAILLAACLAVPACGAQAASFDCAKAATSVENAICADPALSQADEHMAQAYSKALGATLAPRALRTDQMHWLGSRESAGTHDDLRGSYDRRIAELLAWSDKWQSVRRDTGEAEARRACVAIPDAPEDPCTVDAFANVAGSGDALAFQLQSYTNPQYRSGGGVVVFRRHGTTLTPVIATAVESVTFGSPVVVQSPTGKLLNVPGMMAGTGAFNAGSLYLMDGEKLSEIDTESWLFDLARRLPKGWGAWKGIFPDYAKLTAATPLWKSGDGNCCPTAGRATLRLGIKNGRLVILDLHIRNGEAAATGN